MGTSPAESHWGQRDYSFYEDMTQIGYTYTVYIYTYSCILYILYTGHFLACLSSAKTENIEKRVL